MYTDNCIKCREKNYNKDKNCKNCIPHEQTIDVEELAIAYVPFQIFCSTFSPIESLLAGTVFPELYKPYKRKNIKKC